MTLYLMKEKGFVEGDCFLYFNDELLVHKPLKLSDVVSEDGRVDFNTVTHLDLPGGGFIELPFGMWDIEISNPRAVITDPHVPYVVHVVAFKAYVDGCGI